MLFIKDRLIGLSVLIVFIICALWTVELWADPFQAIAEKINITTRGVLKVGSVACGLSGAILLLQAIFGRINYRWGISLLVAALLMASFEFVMQFILGNAG